MITALIVCVVVLFLFVLAIGYRHIVKKPDEIVCEKESVSNADNFADTRRIFAVESCSGMDVVMEYETRIKKNSLEYRQVKLHKWYLVIKTDTVVPMVFDSEKEAENHLKTYRIDTGNPCNDAIIFSGIALLSERNNDCSYYLPIINQVIGSKSKGKK